MLNSGFYVITISPKWSRYSTSTYTYYMRPSEDSRLFSICPWHIRCVFPSYFYGLSASPRECSIVSCPSDWLPQMLLSRKLAMTCAHSYAVHVKKYWIHRAIVACDHQHCGIRWTLRRLSGLNLAVLGGKRAMHGNDLKFTVPTKFTTPNHEAFWTAINVLPTKKPSWCDENRTYTQCRWTIETFLSCF
jgi:hypothetical protein